MNALVLRENTQLASERVFEGTEPEQELEEILAEAVAIPVPVQPRVHQIQAVTQIVDRFQTERRTQVHMACGTGKTLVGFWVGERLQARTMVVFVPSLALIRQTYQQYSQASRDFAGLAVCSDATIMTHVGDDFVLNHVGCQVTRDADVVRTFVAEPGRRIVFCTYQSAEVLRGLRFELGIFDEAHKTAGEIGKPFAFALDDENVWIDKRLFMTATPRLSSLLNKTIASMDDDRHYGSVAYSLSFREAVAQELICDYRVIVSAIRPLMDPERVMESPTRALRIATTKAFQRYPIRKAFSFHRTVQEAKDFVEGPRAFVDFDFHAVTASYVHGRQSLRERITRFRIFQEAPKALLASARCLMEGVDAPEVDLVVFANAKRSTVDIVQAVGRAMRPSPGKLIGYILIPIYLTGNEALDAAADRTNFATVLEVLAALRDQDRVVGDMLRRVSVTDTNSSELQELIELDADEPITEGLRHAIGVRLVDGLLGRRTVAVLRRKDELRKLARAGTKKPGTKTSLGQALSRYTKKTHPSYDESFGIEIRELAPEWFLSAADEAKKEILRRAREGERPKIVGERKLFDQLFYFTKPGHKAYDEKFTQELYALRPDWLAGIRDRRNAEAKRELIKLAKQGKWPEGKLRQKMRYFIRPSSEGFDALLLKALEKEYQKHTPKEWIKRQNALLRQKQIKERWG